MFDSLNRFLPPLTLYSLWIHWSCWTDLSKFDLTHWSWLLIHDRSVPSQRNQLVETSIFREDNENDWNMYSWKLVIGLRRSRLQDSTQSFFSRVIVSDTSWQRKTELESESHRMNWIDSTVDIFGQALSEVLVAPVMYFLFLLSSVKNISVDREGSFSKQNLDNKDTLINFSNKIVTQDSILRELIMYACPLNSRAIPSMTSSKVFDLLSACDKREFEQLRQHVIRDTRPQHEDAVNDPFDYFFCFPVWDDNFHLVSRLNTSIKRCRCSTSWSNHDVTCFLHTCEVFS